MEVKVKFFYAEPLLKSAGFEIKSITAGGAAVISSKEGVSTIPLSTKKRKTMTLENTQDWVLLNVAKDGAPVLQDNGEPLVVATML